MQEFKADEVEKVIYLIRGQKVILDSDLAKLYGVSTGALNRSVKRHPDRFPDDFMFALTAGEYEFLRCQIGILKKGRGAHRKYLPSVFTEQGVAMLSGLLNSPRAIQVNVSIMRTFARMRRLLLQESLEGRLSSLEKGTDRLFRLVFQRLDVLEVSTPVLPSKRRRIGL